MLLVLLGSYRWAQAGAGAAPSEKTPGGEVSLVLLLQGAAALSSGRAAATASAVRPGLPVMGALRRSSGEGARRAVAHAAAAVAAAATAAAAAATTSAAADADSV